MAMKRKKGVGVIRTRGGGTEARKRVPMIAIVRMRGEDGDDIRVIMLLGNGSVADGDEGVTVGHM